MNDIVNGLLDKLSRDFMGGSIIPLNEPICSEYISAGFISRDFTDYFGSYPYAEDSTDKYHFTIRRVDGLINMRVWKIA